MVRKLGRRWRRPSSMISGLGLGEIEQGAEKGQTHEREREQQAHDGTS
jgi:hypothetical protein